MKYLAAYLLLVNAGNPSPSAADVSSLLKSISIEVDEDKLKKLISEVEGKNAEELIAAGTEKLSSIPTGGASTGSAVAASSNASVAEKVSEEAAEESDDDMGFGLFD